MGATEHVSSKHACLGCSNAKAITSTPLDTAPRFTTKPSHAPLSHKPTDNRSAEHETANLADSVAEQQAALRRSAGLGVFSVAATAAPRQSLSVVQVRGR